MSSTSTYQPPLLLDSGAYSAFTRKQHIKLEDYVTFLKKHLAKKPDMLYINLDVISEKSGEASYKNWMTMRSEGLDPIPVYHIGSDEKWLRKYLKRTDYIGLGAIADMVSRRRIWSLDRIWHTYLTDARNMPSCRVHAMGVASFPLMTRYPWYSLDSTSWMQQAMYGKLFMPHATDGGSWDYGRKPYLMGVSFRSPTKKQKGMHIDNIPPKAREVVLKWIADHGFVMGKSHIKDEEVVTDVEGVENHFMHRAQLNAIFYAGFVGNLPYPRVFRGKPKGLLV